MKIIIFLIFIADSGSRIGSSYFYRESGIPDPLIFIADPGSQIRILLFLSWIRDPGSSYSIADLIEDPNPDPDPVPGLLLHLCLNSILMF
jgi:hypothetical protein